MSNTQQQNNITEINNSLNHDIIFDVFIPLSHATEYYKKVYGVKE